MDYQELVRVLRKVRLSWRRVNSQPSVHSFYKEYYINLCFYHHYGVPTISINVDDVKQNINDVIAVNLNETSDDFEFLCDFYREVLEHSVNIAA